MNAMLALLASAAFVGFMGHQAQAVKALLGDPATLKSDFNAANGAPRVVIILSPS